MHGVPRFSIVRSSRIPARCRSCNSCIRPSLFTTFRSSARAARPRLMVGSLRPPGYRLPSDKDRVRYATECAGRPRVRARVPATADQVTRLADANRVAVARPEHRGPVLLRGGQRGDPERPLPASPVWCRLSCPEGPCRAARQRRIAAGLPLPLSVERGAHRQSKPAPAVPGCSCVCSGDGCPGMPLRLAPVRRPGHPGAARRGDAHVIRNAGAVLTGGACGVHGRGGRVEG